MILPKLKKIKSEDPAVNEAQSYVREQFGLINAAFLRGRFLTQTTNGVETELITLTGTPTLFEHKLGEKVLGFMILDIRGNQNIWRVSPTASEDETIFINLQASASVQAKVWVF